MIAILDHTSHLFGGSDLDFHPAARLPMVEGLEAREMFSVVPAAVPLAAPINVPATVQSLNHVAPHKLTSVLPLTITGVALQDGQLVALGKLGNTTFTAPLDLTTIPAATPGTAAAATPILNLHVGAIHLNLLGLKVDTSEICLAITAQPGPGNLLGNLLSDVANLLNGVSPLGTVLGGLTSTQLTQLLNGLTSLLNGALGAVTAPSSLAGVDAGTAAAGTTTNILHLSLGPVDLNLLGLDVHLDNCNNGPVTVDITAQSGPGNLLGNLLGGLAHILDTPASQSAVLAHLNQVADAIRGLI